jgi:hypothetical protein
MIMLLLLISSYVYRRPRCLDHPLDHLPDYPLDHLFNHFLDHPLDHFFNHFFDHPLDYLPNHFLGQASVSSVRDGELNSIYALLFYVTSGSFKV